MAQVTNRIENCVSVGVIVHSPYAVAGMTGMAGSGKPLTSGGDDGAEGLPGRRGATATGFDQAGEQSKGAGTLRRASGVTEVARNHPVPSRRCGGVVGERPVGLGKWTEAHRPVVEALAPAAAQYRVAIRPMCCAQVRQPVDVGRVA